MHASLLLCFASIIGLASIVFVELIALDELCFYKR
ncbi:putative membrane protein, partial [Vibrio harveyi]